MTGSAVDGDPQLADAQNTHDQPIRVENWAAYEARAEPDDR